MKYKASLFTAYLLVSLSSFGQERYDTLFTLYYYQKSSSDTPKSVYDYTPVSKEVREYDKKGLLAFVYKYEYYKNSNVPYMYHQEIYTYWAQNDSLKSISMMEVPPGENKFNWTESHFYTYKDNLISEESITIYAQSEAQRQKNKSDAVAWHLMGGRISDTSGWTTVSAIRYLYDDQRRLIKASHYNDYKDADPDTIWLYTYGNDFPDVNSYFQSPLAAHVYNYLYKRDKLMVYRSETKSNDIIRFDIDSYSYNNGGRVDKIVRSINRLTRNSTRDPYKAEGKDELWEQHEYNYKNGLLASIHNERRSSKTKYKLKFLDRLGNLPSTSTSTTRYGDYETTTTTSTYNPQHVDTADMKRKEKPIWITWNDIYFYYDAIGRLVKKKDGSSTWTYSYDTQGRLKDASSFTVLYWDYERSTTPSGIKKLYSFRN